MENIYKSELSGGSPDAPSLRRVMVLEVSQYLERYLWPNFDPEHAVFAEIMSAVLMVNEKFREGAAPWACFEGRKVLHFCFYPPEGGFERDLVLGISGCDPNLILLSMKPC